MWKLLVAVCLLAVSHSLLAGEKDEFTTGSCCDWQTGVWGSVDVLTWTPRTRGLDFAATEDGSARALGAGKVHEVDLQSDNGVRANLGYSFRDGWAIGFGYTHFETSGTNTVNHPGGTGQLFPTTSHPIGPVEANVAIGSASLDYDVFDIVARRTVVNTPSAVFDLYGGFRWADIGLDQLVELDGRNFTQGEIVSTTDFDGFGLRFGGSGRWRFAGGFSLFGSASAAAIRADFDNRRVETDLNGARLQVDLQDNYTQATFNFDTSLGVAWQLNSWMVGAGYEVNVWTNLSESVRFVDDIEQGGFSALTGDLLLDGFFFRVATTW